MERQIHFFGVLLNGLIESETKTKSLVRIISYSRMSNGIEEIILFTVALVAI